MDDIPEKKHSNGKAAKETSYDEVIETSHTSDVFEKHPSTKTSASILDGIYYCRGKGLSYEAQMEVRDGFYILLKGSRINHKQGPSLTKKLSQIRNSPQYIKDYVVVEEIFFTSPSSAAKIVTGRSTNGWTFWSTKDGLLIDSLRE